jgi:hypothetical protein
VSMSIGTELRPGSVWNERLPFFTFDNQQFE